MMNNSKSEPSRVLFGDVYTVEPGYDECAKLLPLPACGGIGALSPTGTKYYDYHGFRPSFGNFSASSPSEVTFGPFLRDFVSIMDYVDEDVRFYCTASRDGVRNYVQKYLGHFLTSTQSEEVLQTIHAYLQSHSHLEAGWRQNIVVGTPYFNNLFYSTSWQVAQQLFSSSAIDNLQNSFRGIRGYDPFFPPHKAFVNYFDGGHALRFFFDAQDDCCWMDDTLFIVSKDFHCSESDYRKSFQEYILFLSNWTLILACNLCMHAFGQCAFGLYWETGGMHYLQEIQRKNWWNSRN